VGWGQPTRQEDDVFAEEEIVQGSGKGRRPRRRPLLIAVAVALVASLAIASTASANAVLGGNTTLTIKKGTAKKLKKGGVKVKPAAGATKAGKTFTFPITGGTLDRGSQYSEPSTPSGTVRHDAGLKFKCKGGKVQVTKFLATFAAASELTGTYKGSNLKVADLNTADAVVTDRGADIANVKAKTAKAFSKKLKKACGVNLKKKTLGTMHVDATAALSVFSGETAVTLAPAFVGKLALVDEVAAAPVAPATVTPGPGPGGVPPTFHFPITGGELNQNTFVGNVNHAGGFTLTENPADAPPNESTVTDLTLDLAGPAGGQISAFSSTIASRAGLFTVAITGTPSITGDQLTANADVSLTLGAAGLLNDLFHDPDEVGGEFAAGEAVGTGTITATIG
jgi:hypothetical protein